MLTMLFKHSFLLILFYISKFGAEDELKNVKPYVDLFHERPKAWHGYVREFLLLTLPKSLLDDFRTTILDVFQMLQTFSTFFRKRMFLIKKLKRKSRPEDKPGPEYNKAVIYSASGKFKHLYNRHILPVAYIWIFRLDEELRLNISFNYIYLSSGSSDCSSGSVTVEKNVKKRQKRQNRPELVYCGQHARFSVYPSLVNFHLKLRAKEMIMYKLSAFFAVMDKFVVINKRVKFRLFRFNPYTTHIFRNKEMLFSYHLQTRKIDHIILKSGFASDLLLFIHDGPGLMFKMFQSNMLVETSTFQCVVQILTIAERNITNSRLYDADEAIRFYPKKLKILRYINLLHDINSEEVFIPDSACYPSQCVIQIDAESASQINVTASHIRYVGEESLECKYAGLVAVEELTDEYKESTTLCSDHVGSRRQSRNFYSHNSSLTLVLYWYEPYSVINVTLNISQSACKTVWLDDCMATSLCSPFITHHDECNAYLRKITRFSKATLRFEISLSSNMFFSLPNKDCIVIQIFHENAKLTSGFPEIDNYQCHVKLGADQILVPAGKITYTILGSLNNYVAKGQYMDELSFFGIADEFCFTHRDMEHIKCQKDLDTPIIHPNGDEYLANLMGSGFGYRTKLDDNHSFNALMFDKVQDIFVFTMTETPTHTKSLMLLTSLYSHTKSWIDIIIQNKVDQHDAVQYPSETISLFGNDYSAKKVRSSISNVLLLRLSKKNSKQNMDIKINIHCHFILEYKGEITTWNSMMTVSEDYFKKNISVPGNIQQMDFYFPQQINLVVRNNYALKAMWVQDVCERYSYFTQMKPTPCIRDKNLVSESISCSSFSAPSTDDTSRVKFTIFNRMVRPDQVPDWNKQNLFSWNKASWLCERTGGSLPYFSSRESLNQLVALLKLSKYFYQFEGIFIGLHAEARNRVRSVAIVLSCIHTKRNWKRTRDFRFIFVIF